MRLFLDFETKSALDIKKVGLDVYARHAEVLMLAYVLEDGPVSVWQPRNNDDCLPTLLSDALEHATKTAWNAAFERAIFQHALGFKPKYVHWLDVAEWLDPSVLARYAGLPGRLAEVSEVLGMADEGKDKDGKRLIRKFCRPSRGGKFKDWNTDPEDWAKFTEYCRQDVIAERAILARLSAFALPPRERRLWELDQKINERGIPVDVQFARNAKTLADKTRAELIGELHDLTGLENPNSVQQMLGWLKAEGYPFESLGAKRVQEAVAERGSGGGRG